MKSAAPTADAQRSRLTAPIRSGITIIATSLVLLGSFGAGERDLFRETTAWAILHGGTILAALGLLGLAIRAARKPRWPTVAGCFLLAIIGATGYAAGCLSLSYARTACGAYLRLVHGHITRPLDPDHEARMREYGWKRYQVLEAEHLSWPPQRAGRRLTASSFYSARMTDDGFHLECWSFPFKLYATENRPPGLNK